MAERGGCSNRRRVPLMALLALTLACSQPRAGGGNAGDAAPEGAGLPTTDTNGGGATNVAPADGPVIEIGGSFDGPVVESGGRADTGEGSDGLAPFVAFPVPSPITFRDKITTGWDGNIWFTFGSLRGIGRMDRAGVITEFSVPNSPDADDLVSGPDSAMWFGRPHGTLGRIDADGSVAVFATGSRGSTADSTRLIVGPDRNIWFLTVSGLFVIGARPENRGQVLRTLPMVDGRAMVIGADGRVWVFARTPEVVVLDGDGGVAARHALPGDVYTTPVVVGPDKQIWYADATSLVRLSQQGLASRLELPRFSEAIGVMVGPDAKLWFTEPRFHRIGRLDAGENITYVQLGIMNEPTRMTVGADGALWFLDGGAGTINRLRR